MIAPPRLARLPLAGAPQAALVGARSASTQDELHEALERFSGTIVDESVVDGSQELSPSRVLVQSASSEELSAFAEHFGVPYSPVPPAWAVLNFAGGIDEYRDTLGWEPADSLNWACRTLDYKTGRFFLEADDTAVSLASYTNPTNNSRVHFYRRDGMQAEVDRDWGRYLVLQDLEKSVLLYDDRKCILGVPAGYPLPRLYARALTLCSGFAAIEAQNSDWQNWRYYRYVPKQIADLLARKLTQPLSTFSHDDAVAGDK